MSAPVRPDAPAGALPPRRRREEMCEIDYREPDGELAATVAAVVAEVLGVDRVGLDDSFYDFGGTSLQAISLCVRLEKATGLAVEPVDVLEHDVLADLVLLLSRAPEGSRG
ncbi:acyl carrier protein [Streptomyces sp. NPDC017949]|uniref:acyl carrier protein n=1 Tax=Streptomyces sp. NPDC017949 TaxID=3365020 RepID=UPI0037A34973